MDFTRLESCALSLPLCAQTVSAPELLFVLSLPYQNLLRL